ncbi:helix-turn-helix transcriptional regulator [Bisbaumannia pacifica]|uniref:helix-turn-helix transcriptional regulator n=1 Tax=Bisbaumannia pacifica TaxID=77098 RepID=UPI003BEEF149
MKVHLPVSPPATILTVSELSDRRTTIDHSTLLLRETLDNNGVTDLRRNYKIDAMQESLLRLEPCITSKPLQVDMAHHDKHACHMKNRIRVLRKAQGLTQADLADTLGVSRNTINSIEVGRYVPSLPLALKLARFFGKPVEEVFDDRSET